MGIKTTYTCNHCGRKQIEVGLAKPEDWLVVPRYGDTEVYCPQCAIWYKDNHSQIGDNKYG